VTNKQYFFVSDHFSGRIVQSVSVRVCVLSSDRLNVKPYDELDIWHCPDPVCRRLDVTKISSPVWGFCSNLIATAVSGFS